MLDETRYGYFDPWFSAVWVNFDPVSLHRDSRNLAPLTLLSLISPLQDDHLRYVKQARTQEEALNAASWFTAYTHEAQHFHDTLITPYGCAMMRSFIGLGFVASLVMADLARARNIYVPLFEWTRSGAL